MRVQDLVIRYSFRVAGSVIIVVGDSVFYRSGSGQNQNKTISNSKGKKKSPFKDQVTNIG